MPGLIDRDDLVATLDRAAERKVTVIAAAAGNGKTSLLRLWVDRPGRDHRIAFVTVLPGGESFWYDVLSGIHAACGTEPPVAAPDYRAKVLSELAAIDGPFVLIIDDAHELTSAEPLTTLLADLPPLGHAIVASRHDLPLGLHKLRLAGQLAEIRDLRFTIEETRQLVAGIPLSDPAIDVLQERTEGWAAGLRLAVLSMAGHPDPERFVAEFSGNDRTVSEYLMAEMLERQPPEVQNLLLRTSLVDRVNGELADVLTGGSGADQILLGLENANAFVVSLDPERTWFRYHHLFAGLLRLELRRTQADKIPALHRLAAQWFADHAQPADAIRHLQAAGDRDGAIRMMADRAVGMALDGDARTVRALLRSFPDPGDSLALVQAIDALGRLRLDDAFSHLEVARKTGEHPLAVTTLDLQLARLRGHFDCVVAQDHTLPNPDLRAVLLLNLGVTEAWSSRTADAERHLREGATLAHDLNRPFLEVSCLAYLGFATRSFPLARQYCEQAIAMAADHGWDTEPVIAPAHATLAWILTWTGDFTQAAHQLSLTRPGTEPGIQLLHRTVTGLLAAAHNDPERALTEFAAAQPLLPGDHLLTTQLTAWTITAQAQAGHLDQARTALAAYPDSAPLSNAAAAIHLAADDLAAARHTLEAAQPTDVPTQIERHLLLALASADLEGSRSALEQALDLAEPDRLILPFATTGAWRLLQAVPARHTKHAALIADILDTIHNNAPAPPAQLLRDPLSPSELRVLRYLPTNLTRPEIAAELTISLNTVNTHLRNIYAKLNATNRHTAVQQARAHRLLAHP